MTDDGYYPGKKYGKKERNNGGIEKEVVVAVER